MAKVRPTGFTQPTGPPKRSSASGCMLVIALAVIGGVVLVFVIAFMSSGKQSTVAVPPLPTSAPVTAQTTTSVAPTTEATTSPAPALAVDARCQVVSESVVARVSAGITPGVVLVQPVYAVKSGDFNSVYFVAGKTKSGNTAVWATNNLGEGGLTYSINVTALGISDWGDGGTTDAKITMDADGAKVAEACATG